MGHRAGLDGCGKSRQNRDLIPDRPARSSVTIPTELPGPHKFNKFQNIRDYSTPARHFQYAAGRFKVQCRADVTSHVVNYNTPLEYYKHNVMIFIICPRNMINMFIITKTMHTIGVDKITLFNLLEPELSF